MSFTRREPKKDKFAWRADPAVYPALAFKTSYIFIFTSPFLWLRQHFTFYIFTPPFFGSDNILHFHISFSLALITFYIFTSPPPASLALTTMPLWVVVMFSRKDPPHLIKDNILGGPQNPDIRYCLISKSFFRLSTKLSNRQFWGEPER